MEAQTKAPLAKGGCLGTAEAGGFCRVAGVHIGLYFRKVPTVNPSVTPPACQLPLAREPLGCSDEAPLVKGGCLGLPRRGDSPGWQVSTLVCTLGKCRLCDPSVTPPACQLPLAREPFCARYLWLGKIPLCQRRKFFLGGQAQKNLLGHRKIRPVQGRSELFFGGLYGRHQTGSRQLCGKSKAGAGNKG